jgi:phytoene dehydrogenase-like protein
VLDDLLESEELKLVLNANVSQYHGSPSTLSILAHAAGQSAYYQHGGCYVKGGAQKLVDYLTHVIRHSGGDVLTRTEAISIDVNDGRVRTITYRNASGTVTSRTDAVVSNLSPEQTYELASQKHKEERTAADSLLSVYLGFDKDLRSVYGKQAFCQFMLREFAGIDDCDAAIEADVTERGFCFADYSQLDSDLCEEGKSYGLIVAPDFLAPYEKLGDEGYRKKKEEAVESFLAALEERYPGIRDRVEYSEVGTPLTLQRYLRTPRGTPYGFAPTPEQYLRRPAVLSACVKNLFFASAWAMSGGVAPVMAVANLCCERLAKQAPPPVVQEAGE